MVQFSGNEAYLWDCFEHPSSETGATLKDWFIHVVYSICEVGYSK